MLRLWGREGAIISKWVAHIPLVYHVRAYHHPAVFLPEAITCHWHVLCHPAADLQPRRIDTPGAQLSSKA